MTGVRRRPDADENGNVARSDGLDRCYCGSKYWRNDRCVDCDCAEPWIPECPECGEPDLPLHAEHE